MLKALFHIYIKHDFYQQKVPRYLSIVPDSRTLAFMERYDLVLMSSAGKYSLEYFGVNTKQSFDDYLRYIAVEINSLTFHLINDDEGFYLVTDINFDRAGDINFTSKKTTIDGPKAPSILEPVYTQRSQTDTKSIGIVKLEIEDLFNQHKPFSAKEFVIHFQTRQTVIEYIVVSRFDTPLSDSFIRYNGEEVFEKPLTIELNNGEQGWLFSSGDHTFTLAERPNYSFSLITRINDQIGDRDYKEKILISNLPTPTPQNIKVVPKNDALKITSQIYVYL